MELQKGFPLLSQQLKALLSKNALRSWRHKKICFSATFLISDFHFLDFALKELLMPRSKLQPTLTMFWILNLLFRLQFRHVRINSTSKNLALISFIVAILATMSFASFLASWLTILAVMSFTTEAEVDTWLLANPMYCPGALHFIERNSTVMSYGVQTNSTSVLNRGKYEDPTFKFQIPLQIAAEREIARFLIGDQNFSWTVGLKEFAHPPQDPFAVIGRIGPTFFLAVAMFGFVFQMSSLVMEKELKLREAMSMMGLYDTAYWMSWLAWEGLLVVVSSIFIVLFGMMFQFDFFKNNNFAILFLVFFLFQLNMAVFAFALSAFVSKSSSATNMGFFNFIIGIVSTFFPYSERFSKVYRVIWSFYPPNLFAKAIQMLTDATRAPQDPGMSWSGRTRCPPNDDECILTMNDVFIWLLGTFVMWFLLALYFDNIIPNPYGVRKSAFYFLYPGYWTGKEGGICTCFRSSSQPEHITPDDEDVLQEENAVKQDVHEGVVNSNIAVQIRGLAKGLWVNLAKDQLFCLLGPNGAGKTTAINCLTGVTPVTSGDALIHGHSIRSSVGMSNIRRIIGVCPQVVQNSLSEVRLTNAAKMRASSYSGGMRRRLSVAIALIGDPKLIILDEPTTGMDPISRRHVWDIIENAKRGRAIILTTHSMEEADILSDRIGIMAKGRLRCIGTSIRLKSRFGTGFIANVSFVENVNGTPVSGDATDMSSQEAVKQFFKHRLNVDPKEENKSFLTFVIPLVKEELLTLLPVWKKFFLNIARKAEVESAAAEGKLVSLNLTTSETSLEIPVGLGMWGYQEQNLQKFLEHDGTSHSHEVPVPSDVQLPTVPPTTSRQGVFNRRAKIHGIVINPDQISETIFKR
ncbi:ABC transporter A family member 2 [Bienertia sinuspersici]